jgi:hypothetical protein
MRIRSAGLGPLWIELEEGARILVAPLTTLEDMALDRIVTELGALGRSRSHEISTGARAEIVALLMAKVQGWEGVTDETGRPVACSPAAIENQLPADVAYLMGYRIYTSTRMTEAERKNSPTPPQSPAAADSSIVEPAAPAAPSLAESR